MAQRLAYVSTKGTGNFHLFTRAIRGGDWSGPETQLSRENSFGRGRQYFSEQDLHIEPAWIRDGRELMIVSNRGVALGFGPPLAHTRGWRRRHDARAADPH